MPEISFTGLRIRLLALVLLAVIPALGLILYSASSQRRLAIAETEKNVLQLTHLAVDNQKRLVEGTHQLLTALAYLPEVQKADATCHALLADLAAQYSSYTGLSAVETDGDVYCSSLPLNQPRNLADRPYIRQALQTGNFSASEYQIGRLTGRPVLSLAYPILDQTDQVQAVLVAALDLAWLNQFAAEAQLSAGSTFTLMDSQGTILARHPDPEHWIGRSVRETQIFQIILDQHEGTAEVTGVDGIPRLYAFTPLPALSVSEGGTGSGTEVNAYASVGIPTEIAFAEVNRTLARNLLALGLVIALGVLAAWFGSEVFVLRQVRALLQTTKRVSAGDLGARIGLSSSSGELNQLAQAFNNMAQTLQQRETERNRIEAAQRFLAEASLLLASSIDYETTLTHLAQLATPHIADWCAVDILAEDGTLQQLAVAHIDPAKVEWAHELQRRFPYDPNASSGVAQVLRTGQAEFYPEIPDELLVAAAPDPETLHILRTIGFTSVITIPLQARGHILGVITLVSAESGRRYDTEDLALAEDLARRAAIAIDNARLYRRAQKEIVERKQVEVQLAEEHSLLRTFIDNIPDAVYVKNTESRFLIANKKVAALMGTAPEQLIGQTDFDFYPEELARQYYSDEQILIASGQALINKEEPRLNPTSPPSWILTTKVPLLDSEGRTKGIVGISRDITQRKQMEQALQKAHDDLEARVKQRTAELISANEQLAGLYKMGQIITAPLRLDTVLELIVRNTAQLLATDSCVILLLDEAGEMLTVKGAYGISEDTVKGTRDRLSESIAGRVAQTGQPLIANDLPHDPRFYNPAAADEGLLACASVPLVVGEKIIGTLDVHSKVNRQAFSDAHIHTLKMLASQAAIALENARLYEQVQRARDELEERVQQRTAELVTTNQQLHQEIIERKRAEEKLEQTIAELERSNAELQQFAYVASHDLQEPLRMVASYTQLLARRYKGKLDADADDFIAFAVDGANRMQRLINDLLSYSRVGTQGKPFALIQVETALDTALANLEMILTESQAVVTYDTLPTVLADEIQLSQLFQNLIGNALKFRSAEPPTVHISAKRQDHDWLFSVRDNGIGLEPQYAERIFVIFQRLHNQGDYPGTGIGLAICKRIVERHGGRIWVESQAGQGATFHFTLPVDGATSDD